jgi:hypothetical protein
MEDVKQLTVEETAKFTELVKKERDYKIKAWGYVYENKKAIEFAKANGFVVDKAGKEKYVNTRKQDDIDAGKW